MIGFKNSTQIYFIGYMLKDSDKQHKNSISISTIQRYIFFTLLFILPFTVIPFPWDWTEKSISLVLLIFTTIIVGLESIKLIWESKTTYLKSVIDKGSLLILLSLILSTIFSKDVASSLWGVDNRLGSGLVVFISLLILTFCARSFIRDIRDVKLSIMFFLGGLLINNILSIFSFLGVNIWGPIPVFKDLHQPGLPLLGSAKLHILINIVSILLCLYYMVEHMIRKENGLYLVLSIIFLTTSIINIWVYSINHGISLLILMILLFIAIWIFGIFRLSIGKREKLHILGLFIGILLLIAIPVILIQIPSVRQALIPQNINLVSQVSLGNDISWVIASSVLMTSLGRALVGLGVDTYTIAYNIYKPLNTSLVAFNQVNFYNAGNELLTKISNGGFVWFIVWVIFGILLFRSLILDIKGIKKSENNVWMLLIIDFILIFIFLSSLFIPFSVLILFIILLFISLRIVVKDSLLKGATDRFALKLSTVNLSYKPQNEKNLRNINIFITVFLSIFFICLLIPWITKLISSAYILKAESFIIEQNKLYTDGRVPTLGERDSFVTSLATFYTNAVKYDTSDSLANRKAGIIYLEKLGVIAEKYNKSDEGSNKDKLLSEASQWRNYALDYTEESIKRNPYVYANWDSRYKVLLGLISMGYNDYYNDALNTLERATELNPNNFELYYNKAQINIIEGENTKASELLIKVLNINPKHIPSLILMGRINKDSGNTVVYESYLKAAKKIMEALGETDTDTYKQISTELLDIVKKEEPKDK